MSRVNAATHPSPQLMKLGQAETLSVLYHHHRGVGNINPYFNDRSRNEDIHLMILELNHEYLSAIFLNELMNTTYMDLVIKPLTARSAQPHINADQVKNLPIIKVPLEDQIKFATFSYNFV